MDNIFNLLKFLILKFLANVWYFHLCKLNIISLVYFNNLLTISYYSIHIA